MVLPRRRVHSVGPKRRLSVRRRENQPSNIEHQQLLDPAAGPKPPRRPEPLADPSSGRAFGASTFSRKREEGAIGASPLFPRIQPLFARIHPLFGRIFSLFVGIELPARSLPYGRRGLPLPAGLSYVARRRPFAPLALHLIGRLGAARSGVLSLHRQIEFENKKCTNDGIGAMFCFWSGSARWAIEPMAPHRTSGRAPPVDRREQLRGEPRMIVRLDRDQAPMRKVGGGAAPNAAGERKGPRVGWKCCRKALKRFDLGMDTAR